PLTENEKRHFSKYGKWPGGAVVGQQPKERMYFDSGDFALSAAHRDTDNGTLQTGRAYPYRGSISHPYAPIPATSNVEGETNQEMYRKSVSSERSPLLQHSSYEDGDPTKKEEQRSHASHNGSSSK
ncbi:uncharacterized protein N7482_009694, partial [Penicillium canariense]